MKPSDPHYAAALAASKATLADCWDNSPYGQIDAAVEAARIVASLPDAEACEVCGDTPCFCDTAIALPTTHKPAPSVACPEWQGIEKWNGEPAVLVMEVQYKDVTDQEYTLGWLDEDGDVVTAEGVSGFPDPGTYEAFIPLSALPPFKPLPAAPHGDNDRGRV